MLHEVRLHRMQSAFTLIELLVVIGIIVFAGAVVFSVVARSPDAARKSSRALNTQQSRLTERMYQLDYY